MWIQEESERSEVDSSSPERAEAEGRWDVGLGERLVQTIWNWLGRDAGERRRGLDRSSSDNSESMRKAA